MFAEKLVKFFSSPLVYTYSSQMCPAIYLPAPALKLAHKSVRRQIAPPIFLPHFTVSYILHKKVWMYRYFHIPTYYIPLSHSHLCDEKSHFFLSKLFRFTHTVFKFRANFQKDILWNMICIWWIWICTFFRYSNTLHVVLYLLILNLKNGKNNWFLASDGSRYLLTKISKPFFGYLKKFCIWQTS